MSDVLPPVSSPGRAVHLSAGQMTLASVSAREHPNCLVCSAANPLGLKLAFEVQRDGSVISALPCDEMLQSYPETLHGGVVSAVLDAAMTNALFSVGVVAVTAELTVRFLAPVSLGRRAAVRGWIERSTAHRLHYVRAELDQDGRAVARASAKFVARGR
jgi:uncharacterized protein (TIGR00369 family)